MIALELYQGKTCEELGLPVLACKSRTESLNSFLAQWTGSEDMFVKDYLDWLRSTQVHPKIEPEKTQKEIKDASLSVETSFSDPTYSEMFYGFRDSLKSIAASGIRLCDKERHLQRYRICQDCERFLEGRCRVCGCFMKLKTRFSAMRCPLGKWDAEEQ